MPIIVTRCPFIIGSCGNACCVAEFELTSGNTEVYKKIKDYLAVCLSGLIFRCGANGFGLVRSCEARILILGKVALWQGFG